MPEPVPAPEGPGPAGLLLSRDLIFTSKVTGTARMLGRQVLTAGNAALAQAMIEQWKFPRRLRRPRREATSSGPRRCVAYRTVAGPATAFVAFGSHVDTASLAAAEVAGCDPVLPRSKFSAELPELIRRFLGADESASS